MAHEYAKYIWGYFKNKGCSDYGIAGLMGNLQAESGLCPYRLQGDFSSGYSVSIEYTENVNNGTISKDDFVYNAPNGGGYGLAQWTFWSRKQELYEWYRNKGYSSIGSIELACDFLYYELGKYGLLDLLKNGTSIRAVSDVILHDFENPANQSEAVEIQRAALGQSWYDVFAGGSVDPDPDEPDDPAHSGTESDKPFPKQKKMSLMMLIMTMKR